MKENSAKIALLDGFCFSGLRSEVDLKQRSHDSKGVDYSERDVRVLETFNEEESVYAGIESGLTAEIILVITS